MKRSDPQSGSVLFFILIAVALFAALSFVVANMLRGGEHGANRDTSRLAATELVEYSNTVRNAIRTMHIAGTAPESLCFDNANWGDNLYAADSCSDNATRLFDPAGGGVAWQGPSRNVNDGSPWLFTGVNGIEAIGSSCAAESCADLKMILPGVKREVCIMANELAGIPNPNGEPPVDAGYDTTPFTGSFAATGTGNIGDETTSAGLSSQATGCFRATTGTGAGHYHFYRVLVSR